MAKALDSLEVQIQHNFADFSTWEDIEYDLVYTKMDKPCSHDSFLREVCEAVKEESEKKMEQGGVDLQKIKKRTNSI